MMHNLWGNMIAAANTPALLLAQDSENFIFWLSMILCGLGVLIVIRGGRKKK